MTDMVDCGYHTFKSWARQTPSPALGFCWYNQWLGEFDPSIMGDEANRRLDQVDKITPAGQEKFKRGWESAQSEYMREANAPD